MRSVKIRSGGGGGDSYLSTNLVNSPSMLKYGRMKSDLENFGPNCKQVGVYNSSGKSKSDSKKVLLNIIGHWNPLFQSELRIIAFIMLLRQSQYASVKNLRTKLTTCNTIATLISETEFQSVDFDRNRTGRVNSLSCAYKRRLGIGEYVFM